jgi:hypothetical protein
VELGTPTGTVITVGTESRVFTEAGKVDERESGPVETFFTGASKWLGYLTNVPTIGPIAKASSMVSSGLGALASIFGFSVPTMNNEPMRVKNQPYQNGAQVIGYDTGKRITLDPKQELSVDPRALAVSDDHMHISELTSRKSLLDIFTWPDGTVPLGAPLWTGPVTPMIMKRYLYDVPAGEYLFVPTGLAMAAAPFRFWRGDIIFTFHVVCSGYHRGKLAFYFEPNVSQAAVIDAELDLNKQFVKVIDLQETQTVSFRIEWAHVRAWAEVMSPGLLGDLGGIGYLGPSLADYVNGYMAVTPLTSLQSPDGSDIEVNVFVHSDNMLFNQMGEGNMPLKRPTTESRAISDDISLNESSASMDGLCDYHFGELPVSFRSLMKRFVSAKGVTLNPLVDSVPGASQMRTGMSLYPAPSPAYSGVAASSFKPRTLFSYLRYGYVGMRGGTRRRFGLLGSVTVPTMGMAKVSLADPSTSFTEYFASSSNYAFMGTLPRGTVTFSPATNAGIEFEIPMYTNNLFAISFSDDPYPASFAPINPKATRGVDVGIPVTTYAAATVYGVEDFATAEDFSFFRYQGAPAFLWTP